jgi:MFS family permease
MSMILGPAFSIAYFIASPFAGAAADRLPRRRVVLVFVTLWGLATMMTGLARSFAAVFLARVGVGVGEAGLSPAAYSMLADTFPKNRLNTALALYASAAKIGGSLAFALTGVIVAFATTIAPHITFLPGAQPWHLAMILVGVPPLLLGLLVMTFSEPVRKGVVVKTSNSRLLLDFVKANRLLLFLLVSGFTAVGVAHGAYLAWVPSFMDRNFGWTPLQYGPALGLVALAGGVATVVKGTIVDFLQARGMADAPVRFFTWLLVLSAPIACGMFFVPHPVVFLALYAFMSAVALAYLTYCSATIILIAPNQIRAQLIATMLAVLSLLGQGTGPVIVGSLTTYVFHEGSLGLAMAITCGGGLILSLVLLRAALKPLGVAIRRVSEAPAVET